MKGTTLVSLLSSTAQLLLGLCISAVAAYQVGVGIGDVTAPIGEINMLGYAMLSQSANGIHLRLKSRAVIMASDDLSQRVVFVTLDAGFMSRSAKKMALDIVHAALGALGAVYTEENVMISATHTHAGPGGWSDDFLYQATSLGIVSGERQAFANGIAASILKAHADLLANGPSSTLAVGKSDLTGASINRSPPSYLNNPVEEQAQYSTNVDQTMTVLSIKDSNTGRLRGAVSWFAVHGVSMNNTNELVSGDNHGFASYKWELQQKLAGNPTFVGAFPIANAGDVSPNTPGPHCSDTGDACDGSKNSCGGQPTKCFSHGPGYDMGLSHFYSTEVIGTRMKLKAQSILDSGSSGSTSGPILYRYAWVDMSAVSVTLPDGSTGHTCTPAMGYAFAAGTTDGVGTSLSFQGDNSTAGWNKLLNIVRDALATPSAETQACHAPKPILLDTGDSTFPYLWQPKLLPLQLFVIGRKFIIIGQPSEITTMAGRRLRNSVKDTLVKGNIVDADANIVIAGLSNSYSSYVTTREEYQIQRYEGGSTIFGPNTLLAYQKMWTQLAASIYDPSQTIPVGMMPPTPSSEISLLTPVVLDTTPIGQKFGGVVTQPYTTTPSVIPPPITLRRRGTSSAPATSATAKSGRDTVTAVFYCAHPRNGARVDPTTGVESFVNVEVLNPSTGAWSTYLTDEGWDTKFSWARVGVSDSHCTVSWDVGHTVPTAPGTYRFHIYGVSKTVVVTGAYDGVSDTFTVVT